MDCGHRERRCGGVSSNICTHNDQVSTVGKTNYTIFLLCFGGGGGGGRGSTHKSCLLQVDGSRVENMQIDGLETHFISNWMVDGSVFHLQLILLLLS